MKRLSVAVLFGASAACFATTLGTRGAWAFLVVALVSLFWKRRGLTPATALAIRKVLFLGLGVTVLYGWLLMVYPVLSASAIRFWSLTLGYTLGALGSFFLLHLDLEESEVSASSTTILAAVGMLVIASLDLQAAIHGFLVVAGASGFAYLAAETLPVKDDRPVARLVGLGLVLIASAALAASIVVVLPLAQTQVEETMVSIYTPLSDGIQGQQHSRLGELQKLKLSKKIVLRVWSERPQRLRSRILVRFDKTTWHRDTATMQELAPTAGEADVDQASREFLDTLPGSDFVLLPERLQSQRLIHTKVIRVDGGGLTTPGGTLVVHAPVDELRLDTALVVVPPPRTPVRVYGVLHEVNHQRAQEGPSPASMLEASLQVPENMDLRFQALANELARDTVDDEARARRVVAHLRERYQYSLDVGDIDRRDPLADFLFEKKKGWCEYFAGSAAILLRLQGIPTRYVRGFNVIGSQKKGDHYVVREWDRHAWIEAYIEGKGWLEYDPTPAAEYENLHAGLNDNLLTDALEWLRASVSSLYVELRYFETSRLGWPLVGLGLLLVIAWTLKRLVRFVRTLPGRSSAAKQVAPSALEQLVRELDVELDGLGCARPKNRAPLEHWSSLPSDALPPNLRDTGLSIILTYYRNRFGGEVLADGDLERLRRELAHSVTRSSD